MDPAKVAARVELSLIASGRDDEDVETVGLVSSESATTPRESFPVLSIGVTAARTLSDVRVRNNDHRLFFSDCTSPPATDVLPRVGSMLANEW